MHTSVTEEQHWRRYRTEELESQYRLVRHPDRDRCYAEYAEASKRLRETCTWTGIRYGDDPRECLELYPGAEGKPLFVFLHGGYWRGLEAATFSFLARSFIDRGYHFANIEYPLAPVVTMTEIARSAHAAVARAIAEASARGADTSRCVLAGHSAGGHLAALIPSLHRHIDGLEQLEITGTLPISGLFDLEPLLHISLNETLGMDPVEARRLSPAQAIGAALPPSIVAVGGDETEEFRRQSVDYAAGLRAAGVNARVLLVPSANHFTVLKEMADQHSILFDASMALLDPSLNS